MEIERLDLRRFLGETLERLGTNIPDDTVFTCRFGESPDVHANPHELRDLVTNLLTEACRASGEVRLRTGTVVGRSGPHAFVEVSRPGNGTRIVVPVPVFRREVRLAGVAAERSRQSNA